jgi:hypothetical protein
MSKTFTVEEVAELADRSVATIKKWIKRKLLKAHRSRQYLVEAVDGREFLLKQATVVSTSGLTHQSNSLNSIVGKAGRRKVAKSD